MKLKTTLLSLGLVCVAGSALAETAAEIITRHETAKATELEAWMAANPEDPQRSLAIEALLGAYSVTEETGKMTALLEEKYDLLMATEQPDIRELLLGVVQPLVSVHRANGDKDAAAEFLNKAYTEVGSMVQGLDIQGYFDGLQAQLDQPGIGDTMEIAFTSLDGKEVDLADMKDKVVLVDFWATWCGPCIAELPNLQAAYEEYSEKGFEIIGISLDQDPGNLSDFLEEEPMPWLHCFDGESGFAEQYGIQSIPATFLIGKDGKIVATDLRGRQLEAELEKRLGGS